LNRATRLVLGVLLLLLVTSAWVPAFDLKAQETVQIAEPRHGTPFRIVIDTLVTLSDNGEGVGAQPNSTVVVDALGRYWIGPTWVEGTLGVWAPDGQFLHSFGRPGEGPGEFRRIGSLWFGSGDTLNVSMHPQGRSVIGPDGTFVRRHHLPGIQGIVGNHGIVPLEGGGVLVGKMSNARELYRRTAHVFSAEGGFLRSIGTPIDPAEQGPARVAVTLEKDSSVWIALEDQYRLEHVTLDGEILGWLEREVDWFPAPGTDRSQTKRNEANPRVMWIHSDPEDRLWVHVALEKEGQPTATERIRGNMGWAATENATDAIYEVIDPRSGRLLARMNEDGIPILGFIHPELAYCLRELETGELEVLVLRPRLVLR